MVGPIPPHPGGGAISRLQLASGFAKAGNEICVIAPITEETLRGGDRTAASSPEIRVVRYLLRNFERHPFRPAPEEFEREERASIESLFPVLVRSFAPDLVVVGRESFARYVPRLAEEHRLPSVLLVRGSPTHYIIDGKFPPNETERLLREFRRVDQLISVSRHLADGLRGLGFENVSHIRNGIDTRQFQPGPPSHALLRELAIEPDSTVVLVPANLHARKRPLDVVRSAEVTLRQNRKLVYVMAGTGTEREKVERDCATKGLTERFRFLGWVDYKRMPELMNVADIVVVASDAEGLARAYLEAMACGRLLIASDIPPAREVVEDGVNGLLFRVGDFEHLAARTVEAAAHPALRDEIGQRAREAVAGWTVEGIVPQYVREFKNVVSRHELCPAV